LRIRLPENYKAHHLILMLKLKDGEHYVGPNLLLCIKISTIDESKEVSAFSMENDIENIRGQGLLDAQLKMIAKGHDVYTE